MADLKVIRQAIADRLSETFATAADGTKWEVSPRWLAQPPVPCMVVIKGPTEYGEAMGVGVLAKVNLRVVALVNLAINDESQDLLDELLSDEGETSVYRTLMEPDSGVDSRVTLGGAIADLVVTDDSGHKWYRIAASEYLGAEWNVEVYA